MSLEIIAKSDITSVTTSTNIISDTITIKSTIEINRSTDNIGQGGFGTVYKYYDTEKEDLIAIKIYEPSIFQTSEPEIMKKRFLREGKKLLDYSHPNVVKAYDYGFLGDESAYIKMEYISGERLSDFIITNSPLQPSLINSLCYQYIDGMAYVHSKTDLHRDISYSNVMITSSNEIKILDFGFARNKEDTNYDTEYCDIQRKFVIPTEKYTFRTEIYCIGAILYTIITGTTFDNYDCTLIDKASCEPILKDAIKICLSQDASNRFENAIELKNFIQQDNVSVSSRNFSLDYFHKTLKDTVELHLTLNSSLSIEATTQWINTSYRQHIENSTFQSTINLISLLKHLSGVTNITYYKNVNYDLEKKPFIELLNFYDTLSPDMQALFIRNIHLILLEVSKNDDIGLPFS